MSLTYSYLHPKLRLLNGGPFNNIVTNKHSYITDVNVDVFCTCVNCCTNGFKYVLTWLEGLMTEWVTAVQFVKPSESVSDCGLPSPHLPWCWMLSMQWTVVGPDGLYGRVLNCVEAVIPLSQVLGVICHGQKLTTKPTKWSKLKGRLPGPASHRHPPLQLPPSTSILKAQPHLAHPFLQSLSSGRRLANGFFHQVLSLLNKYLHQCQSGIRVTYLWCVYTYVCMITS